MMLPLFWILNAAGEPIATDDVLRWAAFMESADRRIALDQIGSAEVSTVFLGLDSSHGRKQPPVLWETMIFGGKLNGIQQRYTSKADAIAGHQFLCLRVRAKDMQT